MLHRGDIFFADFGYKRRPWLVVQNDVGNEHSEYTIIVPLTSKTDKKLPTHCIVCWGKIHPSSVHCEEIRQALIDEDWRVVEHLPPEIMRHVDECLKVALGLR